MITLADIRGQDRAIARLRRAIASQRVAHAYLFSGPSGCGKQTTALALAAALNCLSQPGEGCTICAACERIAAGIHPDVQTLERQGATQIIPIATIRDQMIPQLALPPHEGRARLFLIEEANSLPEASANALLKTLEEPPDRTHFILCTTSAENLLPTVRSRCQRIHFATLPTDLRAHLAEDDEQAAELDDLSGALQEAARDHQMASLHESAREVSGAREHIDSVLERLSERLHHDARDAAVNGRLGHAASFARQAMQVLETRAAIAHNAHGQTALEALLHTLRTSI